MGRKALSTVFGRRPAAMTWTPLGAGVSTSGMLGYTYGRVHYEGQEATADSPDVYMRIWRKEDARWKLVVDNLPGPPEDPPSGE